MITKPDPSDPVDIKRWRREMRARLIEDRMALPQDVRAKKSTALVSILSEIIDARHGMIVSLYWPFRGEPDLRPLAAVIERGGGRAALPVVETPKAPLIFRPWTQGASMTRGIWNIPVPDTLEQVLPDLLIAPLVGYDPQNYRLGYGGGYFDRTLAALSPRPFVIGVGLQASRIDSIRPQPHDIRLDAIVTEQGLQWPLHHDRPGGGSIAV